MQISPSLKVAHLCSPHSVPCCSLASDCFSSIVLGVIGYSILPLTLAVLLCSVVPEIVFSTIVKVRMETKLQLSLFASKGPLSPSSSPGSWRRPAQCGRHSALRLCSPSSLQSASARRESCYPTLSFFFSSTSSPYRLGFSRPHLARTETAQHTSVGCNAHKRKPPKIVFIFICARELLCSEKDLTTNSLDLFLSPPADVLGFDNKRLLGLETT